MNFYPRYSGRRLFSLRCATVPVFCWFLMVSIQGSRMWIPLSLLMLSGLRHVDAAGVSVRASINKLYLFLERIVADPVGVSRKSGSLGTGEPCVLFVRLVPSIGTLRNSYPTSKDTTILLSLTFVWPTEAAWIWNTFRGRRLVVVVCWGVGTVQSQLAPAKYWCGICQYEGLH